MPKQKIVSKKQIKKRNIVLISAIVLVSLVLLGVIGKLIIGDISKQHEIETQKTALTQTLADITSLQNTFAQASDYKEISTNSPVNRCSEHSSKGTTKVYTCGSRGNLKYAPVTQEDFNNLVEILHKTIAKDESFSNISVHPAVALNYTDATSMSIDMLDKDAGQKCSTRAILYREATEQVPNGNTLVVSFDCNVNTKHLIFELDN